MHVQLEDRKLQHSRINMLAGFVIVLVAILIARLWYLQIACGDDLLRQSESNRIKLLRTRAPRGTILDCKKRVLATSRPQFVVMVIPDKIRANKEALRTLCSVLDISPAELEVIMNKPGSRPGSPVRAKIDASLETVARIAELRMNLPGVSVDLDQIRDYPDGAAVAHIMGYLREIGEDQLEEARAQGKDCRPGDYVGKAGLEKQYEDLLRGTDGGKEIEVNALGRVVRVLGEKASVAGKTLKLTINQDLQVAAERAMGKQVGAVVALDPRDGAVLAMVSKPDYDPNIFVKKVHDADWDKIMKDKALQNRGVYNVYPPGSTFKPIMSTAGLVYKECTPQTTVSCPGYFMFGRRFGCWRKHGGGINFSRAMAVSCDVWYYNLGHRLEIDRIANVAKQFGIGQATGIDLPRESRRRDGSVGTMPSTAWKRKNFRDKKWWPGETISCAIGQGYVQTSPLQMALVSATVANSGTVYRPFLVKEVLDSDGKVLSTTKPHITRKVNASPEIFKLVKEAMRATVTSGTGGVCDIPGITVCGKTGSAEDPPRPAHGWFISFAPMDNPTIAVAAIVEHGRHGASTAAPVCRAIMDVHFGKKKPSEIGSTRANVSGD